MFSYVYQVLFSDELLDNKFSIGWGMASIKSFEYAYRLSKRGIDSYRAV